MFLKASLVGQICQSGCKKFHFHASNTPALDQRSREPYSRLRAPCPCKQQAVSEMTFTPSHVPSSAFPGHGSQLLMCSSRTAQSTQQWHRCGPPAVHPGQRQPSWPHPSSNLPAQPPSSTLKHAKACWPSCPFKCPEQGGLDGCMSHHVSGSLVFPAQSCLCAYRQKHR